eukprot:4584514-Amphidinium_carterae.1
MKGFATFGIKHTLKQVRMIIPPSDAVLNNISKEYPYQEIHDATAGCMRNGRNIPQHSRASKHTARGGDNSFSALDPYMVKKGVLPPSTQIAADAQEV